MATIEVNPKIKFSILVPSVPSRITDRLLPLYEKIEKQIGDRTDVEVLVFIDNKKRSVGYKRDALVQMAQGQFLAFADDDDDVSDDYVASIVGAIEKDPDADVIVFTQGVTINDGNEFKVFFGIEYDNERGKKDASGKWRDIHRKPFHVCAWRTELAHKERFQDVSYGEDWDWVQRLLPHVKKQVRIDKVLHYYKYDDQVTEAARVYPEGYNKQYKKNKPGWWPW